MAPAVSPWKQVFKISKRSSLPAIPTTSKTVYRDTNGLRKGNTYYYKVRAYKYLKGKYYYSGWSNVRSCKISK